MRPGLRALTAISMVLASLLVLGLFAQGQDQKPPPTPPATQQQPPPGNPTDAPQQKPVFRTGTDLVRVDVIVLDKKGVPVPNLTAADFDLQEDGATQEIRSFQYVKADG